MKLENMAMMTPIAYRPRLLACASALLLLASPPTTTVTAFSPGNSDGFFSLSAYQKARAAQTSANLDASRFHFQILFVDNNNFHGRIAESMFAQIAEYNDALFTLFPYSATIDASPNAPLDSAAPEEAVAVCEALGLCSTACGEDGTSFDLSYLDQYDLIIAVDDEVQSLILRSLPQPTVTNDNDNNDGTSSSSGYEQKCRLLSEFLSVDFCGIENDDNGKYLENMIEPEMWDRVRPFYNILAKDSYGSDIFSSDVITTTTAASAEYGHNKKDILSSQPRMILSENGAAIPNQSGWPLVEAAMLVACAGIARFCLDTMDAQFDAAFQSLLGRHFYRREHLDCYSSVEEADDQLRLGSLSVTGYFSPKERHRRIENHFEELRQSMLDE